MLIKRTQPELTLKKQDRLKSRKTIQNIFLSNQAVKIYPFKLVWISNSNNKFELKMGVSAPKRVFKLAVTRNFIKRRMRECLRLNKSILIDNLSNKDISLSFMLLYTGNKIVSFDEFNAKIKQLLVKLSDTV
jgi:ribonuclease P protein component